MVQPSKENGMFQTRFSDFSRLWTHVDAGDALILHTEDGDVPVLVFDFCEEYDYDGDGGRALEGYTVQARDFQGRVRTFDPDVQAWTRFGFDRAFFAEGVDALNKQFERERFFRSAKVLHHWAAAGVEVEIDGRVLSYGLRSFLLGVTFEHIRQEVSDTLAYLREREKYKAAAVRLGLDDDSDEIPF